MNGNDGGNVLNGGDGNDTLNGGAGGDLLRGGRGNDIFVITDNLDDIVENANEGIDTVRSAIDFTLKDNFENLTLTGASVRATGNALNNVITGNDGNNFVFAEGGNDTLIGGAGNDFLVGGAGNDKMAGGIGDDTYNVDSKSDSVTEAANQGLDLVQSSIDFILGANIESLTLGNDDIDGTGNALSNLIFGGEGANVLDGGAGDDLMEGRGDDDILLGGAGNDTLDAGLGSDVIDGGLGADTIDIGGDNVGDLIRYTINSASELSKLGGDIIRGFEHGEDKISLSDLFDQFNIENVDAFGGGFLKIEVVGNNTNILFDRNGGGDSFITLATLQNVTNITADDLITTQL